jgi:hypothetical protein
MLPDAVDTMRINGLTVRDACVDLAFARHGDDVGINVMRRQGDCAVVVHM